jgi:5-methylcytosine-specific restriction endonuclease McrA
MLTSSIQKIIARGSVRGSATFSKQYQYYKKQRTPCWLTFEHLKQIELLSIEALRLTQTTGVRHEVDHIIPLRGQSVSGLHVPWNLQIITKSENASKRNKFKVHD